MFVDPCMKRKNLQQWQFCRQSVTLALQYLNLALQLKDAHIPDGLMAFLFAAEYRSAIILQNLHGNRSISLVP